MPEPHPAGHPGQPAFASAPHPPGTALGDGRYVLGSLVRTGVFAHHHEAIDRTSGCEVAAFVIRDEILASGNAVPGVVELARAAAAIDSPHVARILDAGADARGAHVVTETIEGHTLRELLGRKRAGGGAGFAPASAYPIVLGALSALAAAHARTVHGALTLDAVYVARDGSLKVADFGLAAALPQAAAARTITDPSGIAPERGQGQPPGPPGDVFAAGALLYQLLVGEPPFKGCPPPSRVAGVPPDIDTLVLRCMADDPETRPSSAEAAHELGRIAAAAAGTAGGAAAAGAGAAPAGGAASGDDDALAAALADPWERWLVSKNKLDYGPYSTAELLEQIRADQVLPQHIIMDKDTGDRTPAGEHPVFAGVVEQAAQQRDDRRRAGAEEQHVKQERRRGVALYGVIGAGVLVLGLGAYTVVDALATDDGDEKAASVGSLEEEAKLRAKISFPEADKTRRGSRSGGGSSSGGALGYDDSMAFDMSDDSSGGGERLSNAQLNGTIQKYGGRLGRCLTSTGSSRAQIEFIVKGSGRVSGVRVNGKTGGSLAGCVSRVMRRMRFPKFDGARTKGNFDISL